jgi:hypothetical protein
LTGPCGRGSIPERRKDCPVKDTWKSGGKKVIGVTWADNFVNPSNSETSKDKERKKNAEDVLQPYTVKLHERLM